MSNAKNNIPATNSGEKMVTIKLPRLPKDNSGVFVSVNERTFMVPRGIPVDVPECVAEVLQHQEEEEERAYQFDADAQSAHNR